MLTFDPDRVSPARRNQIGPGLRYLLPVCAALLAPAPALAADAAKLAVADFYRTYRELRDTGGLTGIPNAGQLERLSPSLTPELSGLLSAALAEQQRCAKQYPDDKPPWIEGDIFSSNFEGFTSMAVQNSKPRGNQRSVSVRFTYVEGRHKASWTDTLVLDKRSGRWLVEDIYYHAKFAFTSGFGSHLQSSLKNIPAC
jgi:hypothetical protein